VNTGKNGKNGGVAVVKVGKNGKNGGATVVKVGKNGGKNGGAGVVVGATGVTALEALDTALTPYPLIVVTVNV